MVASHGTKTEHLVTDTNNQACANTGIMFCIEIQIFSKSKFTIAHTGLNATGYCYLHLDELYVSSGQYLYTSCYNLTYY